MTTYKKIKVKIIKDKQNYLKQKNKYLFIDNTDLSNLNNSSFEEKQGSDPHKAHNFNIEKNKFWYSIFQKEHRPLKKQNKAMKAMLKMEDEFRKSRDWLEYYFYE